MKKGLSLSTVVIAISIMLILVSSVSVIGSSAITSANFEEYKSNNKLQKYIDYNKLIKFINSPKDYGKPWYGQLMAGPQMLAYVLQISYMLRKYNL